MTQVSTVPAAGALTNVSPDQSTFAKSYDAGEPQLVWTRLVADLETPVSAYLKLTGGHGPAFLLESVEGGATRGRYSIIGLKPDAIWRANGNSAARNMTAATDPNAFEPDTDGTLASLRAFLKASEIPIPEDLPPMAAGVFGHMGYDTVRLVEHLPDMPPDDLDVPDALLIRPTVIAVFDTVKDEISIVTPVRPGNGSAETAWAGANDRLAAAVAALSGPLPADALQRPAEAPAFPDPVSNTTPSRYLEMVARAKEYIKPPAISFRWCSRSGSRRLSPCPISRSTARYARTNPAPFLFYLAFGLHACRLEPGNPGARARWRGHDPPDCRHRQARRDAPGRRSACR
jgi:anthranilate synthase component 1